MLGRNIKLYRQKVNLTQDAIAEACAVDRATVSKWENGDFSPRTDKLPQLAKLLNCTVDDLLRRGE